LHKEKHRNFRSH